jgi:hypothetical protein
MKIAILLTFLLFVPLLDQALGQDELELDKLDQKLSAHLKKEMPGWKHNRGQSIQGSTGVLIEFWSLPNRVVKISVGSASSAQEARNRVERFVQYDKEKEELRGLGDKAYAWGYGPSNIVFARGKHIFYVSTYADVESDPDARSLSSPERGERERLEMRRLSLEFAKHAATAFDSP